MENQFKFVLLCVSVIALTEGLGDGYYSGALLPVPHLSLYPSDQAQYGYGNQEHGYGYEKCDPTQPPPCAANSSLPFCVEDPYYPHYEIKDAIAADPYKFQRKYSDIPGQSADDLVDGVTKDQESAFDYSYYTGAGTYDKTHWEGPEGYICPSQVLYAQPKRAVNTEGKWRVIVNAVHYYTQTARVEACLFPNAGCRLLAPCYKSKCTQKYVYHRLLSWDPCDAYRGLFIDTYRFPSACSCHIPGH
ncbi:uncharacterized protein LOC143258014 [Tachypleus tridentatus]|uniref:uncharacterized protein LOC143258014 n=1 Tax=Tachypleus tridentatus TaxID=6853 RepID=UPI003FD347D0